jgi:hypothetical protein
VTPSSPTSILVLYDQPYEIDQALCHQRLLERGVELSAGRKSAVKTLVAKEAGVSRATLRLFLEGRNVSAESFIAICRGLSLDWRVVAKPITRLEVAS